MGSEEGRTSTVFVAAAALFGLLTVVLGAFGAHVAADRLTSRDLAIFETAVLYQGLHALALLGIGLLVRQAPSRPLVLAGWSMALGIVLFSGSLYVLVLTGWRFPARATPFGGLLWVVGWICLFWAAVKGKRA